ncbi:hypothetical protein [Bradyrhizobium sp. LHD-71]|uniref:hypothetical protein n=1 Tax=Bradyrhizobium sp. LHD-71 TaxID=3072141 RepID=UPI0028108527|nr:hypothetical protein [Bradyrhizobium sp. LHD-71]MDQ8729024.1 hypothetical protein [Bradyrhizobium sp. LHD-71]
MSKAVTVWFCFALIGLAIGMVGFLVLERMSFVDAFTNSAMILSGMGDFSSAKTTPGKIFLGAYSIFAGLFVLVAAGVVLAPIFHRVLHSFDAASRNDE